MIDVVEPTTILDSGDPNYDSNEEPVTFCTTSGLWETKYTDAIVAYKEQVSTCVEEYFNSADVNEALERLEDLGSPLYQHFIIKRAVTKAMDRGHREMEMTARLISAMHGKIVTVEESVKGFHQLLAAAEDLTIDVPEAPTMLGTFIARGVVDDVLPPSFVTCSETDNPSANAAIKHCQGLLGARHAAERILQIWGNAVGMTVEVAKSKLAALLEEFLVSNDVAEAQRCLHELNLPFFHHELVKKAVFVALEKDEADEHIVFLLETLGSHGEISQNQLTMGLQRAFDALPDLSLDVPDAESHMLQLIEKMKAAKVVAEDFGGCAVVPKEEPLSSLQQFKLAAMSIIREYFAAGDVAEVERRLQEVQEAVTADKAHVAHFVKRLVIAAMDGNSRHREMAAALLSQTYPAILSPAVMEEGFSMLLEAAEDLILDVPDAPGMLAVFLARGVVDDILPPSFLPKKVQELQGFTGSEVARAAEVLLGAKHSAPRILSVWGGAENTTVAYAKEQLKALLAEYVLSGDLKEAQRCVHVLHVPFFPP